MPNIQTDGNGPGATTSLVDGNGRIVEEFNPGNHAPGGIIFPHYPASRGANPAHVHPNSAAIFRNPGGIGNGFKNTL